jgi:hypothetical protein
MGKGNYIILGMKIDSLRDFLNHVLEESSREIEQIESKLENGTYFSFHQYEHDIDYPVIRQELAAKLVFYEINALVEYELQQSAFPAWLRQNPQPKSKSWLFDLNALKSSRFISDENYGKLVTLINQEFDIDIVNLKCSKKISEARDIVNSFKHKNSLINYKKKKGDILVFPEYHRVSIDDAYELLKSASEFITDLWEKTGRLP